MTYDADNIPDAVLDALQRVVADARFTADQVSLCAIQMYAISIAGPLLYAQSICCYRYAPELCFHTVAPLIDRTMLVRVHGTGSHG